MRRLRDAGHDIQGHMTAGPEPHPDGCIAELSGEDATTIGIEGWTIWFGILANDGATLILSLACCVNIAI